LVSSLQDVHTARYWFGEELSDDDKKSLQFIVEELDKLKEGSKFQQGEQVISEHAVIPHVVELRDITNDVELAAAYLIGVHGIMEKYWVKTEMYRQIGRCFDEMEVQSDSDVAEAVNYANHIISSKRYGSLESMCWQSIKQYEQSDNLTI